MFNQQEVLAWVEENKWYLGVWEKNLIKMAIEGIQDYKTQTLVRGFVDAHVHLCRVFTFSRDFFPRGIHLNEIADLDLSAKQELTGLLHDGQAYTEESLRKRMKAQIIRAAKIGTRQIWGVIDTTPDIGTRAFNIALELKEQYRDLIDLKVACYALFGLKNPCKNRDRLDLMEKCAQQADFIVGLPERDDAAGKIGFKGHVNELLELSWKNKKELHLHVDQKNSAYERGSIMVLECLEGLTQQKFIWFTTNERPKLWLIHVISPSCYQPEKFNRLVNKLVEYNIGVICCPVAGISMRQLRSEYAPIHNCLARIIEMLRAGVEVRFGTDNINDFLVPSNKGLIPDEISVFSNIVRNYILHILVKVGMGISLNNGDRAILRQCLEEAQKACQKHTDWAKKTKKGGRFQVKY